MSNASPAELCVTAHAHLPHCVRTRLIVLTSNSNSEMQSNVLLGKNVKIKNWKDGGEGVENTEEHRR
jgi:hypothetical protein